MQQLVYYYKPTVKPLRSVMEVSDKEIVEFMRTQIPEDAIFHADPAKYIRRRRETESWLYKAFLQRGGAPATYHPIYMTLGRSSYIEQIGAYTARLEFPLSALSESTVSFTYPDSYVSRLLAESKSEYFNPRFHGKLFMLSDLHCLLGDGSVHNEAWREEKRKNDFFIEAQVWDLDSIRGFLKPSA